MRKVVLQGLWAHKLRLALTALAIVLGVTFISGTLVLTDTLHNTFTSLFGRVYQNVDFEVRGTAALSGGSGGTGAVRNPIPASIAGTVRRIPGVAYADGIVSGYAQFVSPGGKAISNGGAPTLGLSYDPNSQLSALTLAAGTAPTSPHEVVMDASTAQKYHFVVGDHVRVQLAGPPQRFTISGIVKFGNATIWPGPPSPPSICRRRRRSSM
jgi:putative ABC transport system permease protein